MGCSSILKATKEIPININTYSYNFPVNQLHPETELLFNLYGEYDILIGDKSYHMIPEDICLINSNEIHYISGTGSEALSISFPLKSIMGFHSNDVYFELNSCGNTQSSQFNYVRCLVAQLVKINASGEDHYGTLSLFYALIGHLMERFQIPAPSYRMNRNQQHILVPVVEYIDAHYAEGITLSSLSEEFNITIPYLSSCFEKYMHTTFLTYYNEVRLSHAVHDMLVEKTSLEEIAASVGYHDIRSFTAAFKKKYHVLPSVYRKQNYLNDKKDVKTSKAPIPLQGEEMRSLAKYLTLFHNNGPFIPADSDETIPIDAGKISFQTQGIPLKHTFRKFCCVGSARQFLYAEIQDMIRLAQKEIQYEFVKFHGILSDEMMVYSEDENGTPVYSFTLIDKVIDFLMDVGLKPLVQLSFMPRALASNPDKLIDMMNFNTSPPKDMNKWTDLIRAVICHLMDRYGTQEVKSWLFCVWNEPDATTDSFGWEDDYLFREFYRKTYCTVKEIDAHLSFGTPSLLVMPQSDESWAAKFFHYCSEYHCEPDFINVHYYDNNFQVFKDESSPLNLAHFSLNNLNHASPLTEDQFAFTRFIDELKAQLKKNKMKHLPIYLTEWNLTVSHRDLINDTCFKACYLTKNLLQNYDRLDSYGYWCLTDFHEELQMPNELYHGGLGMFTYNGIPKSHYSSFRFLSHLGSEMIGTGNGYFITKKQDSIYMILYNYEHYSKLFANGVLFDMNRENRYAPFSKMKKAHFKLEVNEFPAANCFIKEFFVNQNSGSSYDAWMRMGGQPLNDPDELELLKEQAHPGLFLHRKNVRDGTLIFETELEPLEVRLIQIRPHP